MIDLTWSDYHHIVDALYRFGAGQDLRDRRLFLSAFAPTATLDFTQPAARLGARVEIMRGRENIADTIFSVLTPLITSHTVTNPRVQVYGNRAQLWALVEAQHVDRSDPSRRLLLKNTYEVELSCQEGIWLIDSITIMNFWAEGYESVLSL